VGAVPIRKQLSPGNSHRRILASRFFIEKAGQALRYSGIKCRNLTLGPAESGQALHIAGSL